MGMGPKRAEREKRECVWSSFVVTIYYGLVQDFNRKGLIFFQPLWLSEAGALQEEEEEGVRSKRQFFQKGKAVLKFTDFPTNRHRKCREERKKERE